MRSTKVTAKLLAGSECQESGTLATERGTEGQRAQKRDCPSKRGTVDRHACYIESTTVLSDSHNNWLFYPRAAVYEASLKN